MIDKVFYYAAVMPQAADSPGRLPQLQPGRRQNCTVITDVTNIMIAAAAVVGLVPLGMRTVHDMIKSHRRTA